MMWFKQPAPPGVVTSEKGFLDVAGRQEDLSVREMTMRFRDLVSADLDWADARKTMFRRRAFGINLAVLILTGASTVVLGASASASRATYALPMVALVTLLGGIEAFWNWRSRWILMEETRYRLNRLRDEMDFYLVTTCPAEMTRERLGQFFEDQQNIWAEVSGRWLVGHRAVQFSHDNDPGATFGSSLSHPRVAS
jgi:hypothetical protein